MTERVTKRQMIRAFEILSAMSKKKYRLEGSEQGWCLYEVARGTRIGYYGTKSETYYTIHTIIHYLENEARPEEGT